MCQGALLHEIPSLHEQMLTLHMKFRQPVLQIWPCHLNYCCLFSTNNLLHVQDARSKTQSLPQIAYSLKERYTRRQYTLEKAHMRIQTFVPLFAPPPL